MIRPPPHFGASPLELAVTRLSAVEVVSADFMLLVNIMVLGMARVMARLVVRVSVVTCPRG